MVIPGAVTVRVAHITLGVVCVPAPSHSTSTLASFFYYHITLLEPDPFHILAAAGQCLRLEVDTTNMPPTSFIPRHVFPPLDSLPRSYYLGHHAAGLSKMRSILSQIDMVIECRDYRIPLTSRNPMFEDALVGKERVVVYTKRDLGSGGSKEAVEKVRNTRTRM